MGILDKRNSHQQQSNAPAIPASSGFGGPVPPTYTAAPNMVPFACMNLSSSDRVRIAGFPPEITDIMSGAIKNAWPNIQRFETLGPGVFEWKLKGNPWFGQGGEAVPSRRLMIHMLAALSAAGWHLALSSDLSKKEGDKDTLFFRHGPSAPRQFFCISFNETDKIRLIDAPDHMRDPFMLAAKVWPKGIQEVKEKEHGCLQLKFRGTPWLEFRSANVSAVSNMMCHLLGALDGHGYEVIGSIDVSAVWSSNNSSQGDMDTWFIASKWRAP